jgi:L-amino acid N-acyltransferase YncA
MRSASSRWTFRLRCGGRGRKWFRGYSRMRSRGRFSRWCKVYQACIQYDARRREHGLSLVATLVRKATEAGFGAIALWCADDLESNDFWRSAGFRWAGMREGGKRRGRKHNRWVMPLQPLLFDAHSKESA